MTVITISRQYESGGDEIARQLCDLLGYRYLDKDLMASLGAQAGSVALVQNFIRGTHGQGGAVIVGRGGQVALETYLTCYTYGSLRLWRYEFGACKSEGLTADEAREQVSVSDQASAGYVKHYYNADSADPSLYDLVINTGKITPVVAADLVIQAMACLPVLA